MKEVNKSAKYKVDETMGFIRFTELPLAITLMCLNQKLLAIESDNNDLRRMEFLFDNTEEIQKLIAGYWDGNMLIEPKKFWNITREIKSRIKTIKV